MLKLEGSEWPKYTQEEADAISDVLLSNRVNYWTGDNARLFEREFASYINSKYAIAVANGTVALDLALKAIELEQGDEVIVTSRTFIASISSIINAGATPIFADVDRETQNIDYETVQAVLSDRCKAIVCVHLAGWPCDMDPIMELAGRHNIKVIEDCAQAHGALYKGRSVGSIGHIAAWSFCQDKIMTTGGEGGMVTTNNSEFWQKMWSYKDHGKDWSAVYERKHKPGFRWLHESFGTNWRMTELQAVIGRIQLKRLKEWSSIRRKYAEKIWETARNTETLRAPTLRCKGCAIKCVKCEHAAYKCYVFVKGGEKVRDVYLREFNNLGVPCQTGSCSEVYLEKAFDGTSFRPNERLRVAKELGETSMVFMCHPTITESQIEYICDAIYKVCK